MRGQPSPSSDAQGQTNEQSTWTATRLQSAMEAYLTDHEHLCLDPNARNTRHTYVTVSDDKKSWRVQQMLVDPEEANDWVAEFRVDLPASRDQGEPVMKLVKLGPLVEGSAAT